MLTQELVQFINSQVEYSFTADSRFSQDYEELLDFVTEKLTEGDIQMFVETNKEGYKTISISPLFSFIIEGIHQQAIQQLTNLLELTLTQWYATKLYEWRDDL